MRRFFLISSAALSLLATGCATPQSVCESGVRTICARRFECTPAEEQSTETFKSHYGTTTGECETRLTALARCDEKDDFNELCTDGEVYDLSKVSACSEAVMAQSCADFNDRSRRPAACDEVCK